MLESLPFDDRPECPSSRAKISFTEVRQGDPISPRSTINQRKKRRIYTSFAPSLPSSPFPTSAFPFPSLPFPPPFLAPNHLAPSTSLPSSQHASSPRSHGWSTLDVRQVSVPPPLRSFLESEELQADLPSFPSPSFRFIQSRWELSWVLVRDRKGVYVFTLVLTSFGFGLGLQTTVGLSMGFIFGGFTVLRFVPPSQPPNFLLFAHLVSFEQKLTQGWCGDKTGVEQDLKDLYTPCRSTCFPRRRRLGSSCEWELDLPPS